MAHLVREHEKPHGSGGDDGTSSGPGHRVAGLGAPGHGRTPMMDLYRFPAAARRDPAVDAWLEQHTDALGGIARHWYAVPRACGSDLSESLHDGHPTACVTDAAFAYVDAFSAHVDLGYFRGA